MREIKFRAWIKGLEEMVEVDELRYFPNEDAHSLELGNIWYTRCNSLTRSMRGIEKVELMQFTGLKDKNGVEIYEGDIIKFGKISLIVEWSEKISSFMGRPNGKLRDWPSLTEHSAAKHGVILGNIYENKELLEAEG